MIHVSKREAQVIKLLLEGCDNKEIAKRTGLALRTVKAHLNRLYMKCGINGGVKRVKLAVLFYRLQLQGVNWLLLHWSYKDARTATLPHSLERPNTLLRTTYTQSMIV